MKAVFTIDFEAQEEMYQFEHWLKQYIPFNVTILPDTKELYEKDPHFKELVKGYNKAKKLRDEYINKHNH